MDVAVVGGKKRGAAGLRMAVREQESCFESVLTHAQ